jgi:hypothetical protein
LNFAQEFGQDLQWPWGYVIDMKGEKWCVFVDIIFKEDWTGWWAPKLELGQ